MKYASNGKIDRLGLNAFVFIDDHCAVMSLHFTDPLPVHLTGISRKPSVCDGKNLKNQGKIYRLMLVQNLIFKRMENHGRFPSGKMIFLSKVGGLELSCGNVLRYAVQIVQIMVKIDEKMMQ